MAMIKCNDEEEQVLSPERESDSPAERSLKETVIEGSFRAAYPNIFLIEMLVGYDDSSPLQDKIS